VEPVKPSKDRHVTTYQRLGIGCWTLLWIFACVPAGAQTPAQLRMTAAEQALARQPHRAEPHTALALALAQRARETADTTYYRRALASLDRALTLAPNDFDALRTRAWVLLGQHEFAAALREAQALNARQPDDLFTYALLVDAHVELGNYAQARVAAQWLLDLRPGNIPGLTRAAYLREIHGDLEGAIELMQQALQRTAPEEVEDRAWLLTQLGHLHLHGGRVVEAERHVLAALELFPEYHYALAQLARVRLAQGDRDAALAAERRHYAAAPHPENRYELARALGRAGAGDEAQRAYAEFEAAALAESAAWDNANRELVYYYADVARAPDRALAVARKEIARRQDVYTSMVYAWALYRSGDAERARAAMERATAIGIRDPELLFRAGIIAHAAGDVAAAQTRLNAALAAAPWSEHAQAARAILAERTELPVAAAPTPTARVGRLAAPGHD
jgi:tetratricopeptide (TPR) repeat protein